MLGNRLLINKKQIETMNIVRRLKSKEIDIYDLTEIEKKEVYLFLQNEVKRKNEELKFLKNMILKYKKSLAGIYENVY